MLRPFFALAMTAPGRHLAFRRLAVVHVVLVSVLAAVAAHTPDARTLTAVGQLLLVLGIVEGAALVGWRLTQLPKSQALEFLLVSPLRPQGVFLAEALVGIGRFALVWLGGVPVLGGLVFAGAVQPDDLFPLAVMPFLWGVVAGVGLTAWVYEPVTVRRVGEFLGLAGVLVYLVVGVLAGENLQIWLRKLPAGVGRAVVDGVLFLHAMNPFGVVLYWFSPGHSPEVAWERAEGLHLFSAGLLGLAGFRAAFRLKGHFHDRHYRPIDSSRVTQEQFIGERPLSWWAVRRVMEYGGRVNLWLAVGFSLAYGAFTVAGDDWPAWMGRLVFQLFEGWGGPAAVAAALVVLSAVPAVFQFGLWDPTPQDRCRRLELLLLTDLTPRDYWRASLAAAWTRGRGYLLGAGALWLALGLSGRNPWWDVLAAAAGAGLLWGLSFAVGFRVFSTGNQTNGLASVVTLGLPLVLIGLLKLGWDIPAAFVPSGLPYLPLRGGVTVWWAASAVLTGTAAVWLTRRGLARCDADLRRWYDRNQGAPSAG